MVFSMTTDKGIFIQNIYYMLSYAYQVLQQQDYQCIASEKFEHIDDLFAAILAKGVSRQLKQGLYREYVSRIEVRSVLRGSKNAYKLFNERLTSKSNYNQLLKIYDQLGYLTLEDDTLMQWCVDNDFYGEATKAVRYDDPDIKWQTMPWPKGEYILSDKDKRAKFLQEFAQEGLHLRPEFFNGIQIGTIQWEINDNQNR